ncbi:MAG TPA: septation protein SepH [Acidimicrobiales bacterium]
MQKLHLVGFTTDHRGLIFSVRRGAKSGSYVVPVDEPLCAIVDELRREIEALDPVASVAGSDGRGSRSASALSVRDVQSRLRRGVPVAEIARAAGVDPAWVTRFAAPVLAEQAQAIRLARSMRFHKPRLGPSAALLGASVYRNLADRGANEPHHELDEKWSARQLREGVWLVTFRHAWRGREHEAVWELDEALGVVKASSRLAADLAFRPGVPGEPIPEARPVRPQEAKVEPPPPPSAVSSRRVAAARRAATARMRAEADKATERDAARVRTTTSTSASASASASASTSAPAGGPKDQTVDQPDPPARFLQPELRFEREVDSGSNGHGNPQPALEVEIEPSRPTRVEPDVRAQPSTKRRRPLRAARTQPTTEPKPAPELELDLRDANNRDAGDGPAKPKATVKPEPTAKPKARANGVVVNADLARPAGDAAGRRSRPLRGK